MWDVANSYLRTRQERGDTRMRLIGGMLCVWVPVCVWVRVRGCAAVVRAVVRALSLAAGGSGEGRLEEPEEEARAGACWDDDEQEAWEHMQAWLQCWKGDPDKPGHIYEPWLEERKLYRAGLGPEREQLPRPSQAQR